MSRIYDNWERLVKATLLREELRWLSRQDSLSSTSSSQFTWSFRESDTRPIFNSANLGISFSYQQISRATNLFNDQNLIKQGHSGDLFTGYFRGLARTLVVKRIVDPEANLYSELEFFSRFNHHPRIVALAGRCLEDENEKFLVYGYMEKRDLASLLSEKADSLDWITRLKIAVGVAEALAYLHHDSNPPLAHGDVQGSSILLGPSFEVRLGSLTQVSAQAEGSSGGPKGTCADDVYCLGKVLLELVTGNPGISSSGTDATAKEMLEKTSSYVSMRNKKLVTNIVDKSLIICEDLLEEVWAVAIITRFCLNPNPTRRPLMRDILKALEDPMNVVRGEHSWRGLTMVAQQRNPVTQNTDLNAHFSWLLGNR